MMRNSVSIWKIYAWAIAVTFSSVGNKKGVNDKILNTSEAAMPSVGINRIDVSSCYFYDEQSFATVSVEFAWEDAPLGDSILVEVPGVFSTYAYIDLPITDAHDSLLKTIPLSSPQVVAFELPADAQTKSVNVHFSSEPAFGDSGSFSLPGECPFLFCGEDSTRLSGLAFLDLNADGIRQFGETTGFEGMTVYLFECYKLDEQDPIKKTTTNANGEYTFTGLTPNQEYKVIFEFPENATMVNTSGPGEINEMIQFATVPNCGVNVSVSDRGLYCQDDPDVALTCFVHGLPIPEGRNDTEILLSVPYSTSNSDNTGKKIIADASEGGSLWGIAWDASNQVLYSSAVLRRHSAIGPMGISGIYRKEANGDLEQWLDLSFGGTFDFGSIPSNEDRGLAINPQDPSVDPDVFPLFGKVGIGGIDIDPFGEYIFACNLFDKHIYKVSLDSDDNPSTAPMLSDVVRLKVPEICDTTYGNTRPWAVKIFDNHLYVGVVCDAEFSQNRSDMRGYVFIYSLLTNEWLPEPAIDFPLTYPKGAPATHVYPFQECGLWNPWNDDYTQWCSADVSTFGRSFYYSYPMPLISDLEFDVDGTLVIAMMDRSAFMTGNEDFDPAGTLFMKSISASGDILRALKFKDVYVLENNGISGPHKGLLSGNRQGPGFGEFFSDNYHVPDSSLIHAELALGAAAILPASQEMIYNAVDPISYSNFKFAAGLRWQSTQNGAYQKGYVAYSSAVLPSFSKSAGLGDLELMCEKMSQITIGNYVWVDYDRDGVQDPCEPPAQGINVSLFDKSGNEIKTLQTDSMGRYFFRSTEIPELRPNTQYDIIFATNGQYDEDLRVAVAGIGKVLPTLPNREHASYGDMMDSDASILHFPQGHRFYTYPALEATTPGEGSVDLSFDFGLSFYDYATKNIIINEKPLPYLKGEEITYQIVVYNFGGLPGFDVEASCYLNGGMSFIPPDDVVNSKTPNDELNKNKRINEGWTLSGDSLVYATIDTLLEGESDTLTLTLIVLDGYGPESWNLVTEVSDARNILGETTAYIDLDGVLDRNRNNNGGNLYRSPADNWLFGDGTATETNGVRATDQDNVDPAIANILDVALQIFPDPNYINNYDSIKYDIVVENQGSFSVDSLDISLKYNDAYCFESSDNLIWEESEISNILTTSISTLGMLEKDTISIFLDAIIGRGIEDWTVQAEISNAFGLSGRELIGFDIDSKLNSDFTDNVGGIVDSPADDYLLGIGTATGPDTVAFTDQDNADKAYILPTDMALTIDLNPDLFNTSFSLFDTAEYIITLYNQGKDTIDEVRLMTYKQPCLEFIPDLNANFSIEPNGFATIFDQVIFPQEAVEISVYFRILPGADCEYINEAEILSFVDVHDTDLTTFDIDSHADSISGNDPLIINEVGRVVLDSIDPCNRIPIVLDEDDHDIAPIPKYDLALKNEVIAFPKKYGDTVCYAITVFNQGNQPVRDIDVIYHLPDGLPFDTALNADWHVVDDHLIYTLDDLLYGEDSTTFLLKSIIRSSIPDSLAYLTVAEILSMYNQDGEPMNNADLDSTPDGIADNDVGGVPFTLTDDHIDDDRLDTNNDNIIDEDDHDPALIQVLDLSIKKEVAESKIYKIGDEVVYNITVTNEGSEKVRGFEIVDYMPSGLTFINKNNPGWILDDAKRPLYHFDNTLIPGNSIAVPIRFIVNVDIQIATSNIIENFVEIMNHQNSHFVFSTDFDSDPDDDLYNDMDIDSTGVVNLLEDDIAMAPIEVEKVDPRGVIYCDATGQLVQGGSITITRAQDNQEIEPVFTVDSNSDTLDGRTGVYQFAIPTSLILDDIDTFRIDYSHPTSTPLSPSCTPFVPVYNADGQGVGGQVVLGDTNVVDDFLQDFSCASNDYFLEFILTDTTPLILGNNIPLRCGALGGTVCADRDTNAVIDFGEKLLSSRLVNLYLCSDTTSVIDSVRTNGSGHWSFDGLQDNCYRVEIIMDQNLVTYANSKFGSNGWSIPFNVVGGTQTIDNNFCFPVLDCDSIFCQSSMNVSVPNGCDYELDPDILLRGLIPRNDFIDFSYIDDNGNEINSNIIPKEYIGRCIETVLTTVHTCPFSPCITKVCFESKNAPLFDCPIDTILCTMVPTFEIAMPNEDCFEGEINVIHEDSEDLCENDSIRSRLIRTYQATDQFGNLSNTCTTELYIKSVDLNEVVFPNDTTLSCELTFEEVQSTVFGLPSFEGIELPIGLSNMCGLHIEYTDQLLQDYTCKKMILRMWTIYQSGCAISSKRQQPQTFLLLDTLGPTIKLADTLRLQAQSLQCGTDVSIDLAEITDNCGDLAKLIVQTDSTSADYVIGETIFLEKGIHTVSVSAFDNCHNESVDSIVVIITDSTPPVSVCLQNEVVVIGKLDTALIIPVESISINQFDNCEIVDVKARKMNISCSSLDSVFAEEITICCADVDQELMVLIRATDDSGNESTCMSILKVELDEENTDCINSAPSVVNPDLTEESENILISGTIEDRYGLAMSDIKMEMSSELYLAVGGHTDQSGKYRMELSNWNENSHVFPYYNEDWGEGLSTLDAIYLQRHLVGQEVLKGYDLIAADVNGDGVVSGLDIIYLRRIILGLDVDIPNNTSWTFEPMSNELLGENEIRINWLGIKTGDILKDELANLVSTQSRSKIPLFYDIKTIENKTVVDFFLNSPLSMTGLQGEFTMPQEIVVSDYIPNQIPLKAEHISIVKNKVKISYNGVGLKNIDAKTPLFSLAIQGSLSNGITLDQTHLLSEIYTHNGYLDYFLKASSQDLHNLKILYNDPNPWTDETTISFTMPMDQSATISITDIEGKLLHSSTQEFVQGMNFYQLDNRAIKQNGVLIYKIATDDNVVTGKMIKIK